MFQPAQVCLTSAQWDFWLWVLTSEEKANTSYPLAFSHLTCENMKTEESTFSNEISRFDTWMFPCRSPDNMAGILMFL